MRGRLPGAVLVMLAVAAVHLFLAGPGRLSPWKGGGFGMFSTIESPASRFVRVRIVAGRERFAVTIPPRLGVEADRLRAWPAASRTASLATELARLRWVTLPRHDSAETVLPYRGLLPGEAIPRGARLLPVEAVEVELWQSVFDGGSVPAAVRARPVTSARVRTGR